MQRTPDPANHRHGKNEEEAGGENDQPDEKKTLGTIELPDDWRIGFDLKLGHGTAIPAREGAPESNETLFFRAFWFNRRLLHRHDANAVTGKGRHPADVFINPKTPGQKVALRRGLAEPVARRMNRAAAQFHPAFRSVDEKMGHFSGRQEL